MNRITRHLGCFAAAAPMLAAIMLSGCSTGGLFGSSSPDQAAASPSLTQRFSSFFSRSEKQTATVPGAEGEPAKEIDCPPVDVRHGTGVMAVNSGPAGASATTLRHQLTIARTARECVLVGENLKMKVGVEGRIVLGPAGTAGPIEAPLRYAVVREGPEPKTILTKLRRIAATVAPGDVNATFVDVDDDITFSMPAKTSEFDAYVVYVGFDPAGAKPEPKKKPPEPKNKPAPSAPRR